MARPIRLDQQDCLTLAQVISRQLSITVNSVFIQTINIIHHLSFADSSVLLCPHHGGARLGSDPPGEQWGKIERAPFHPFQNNEVLGNQVFLKAVTTLGELEGVEDQLYLMTEADQLQVTKDGLVG